MLKGRARAVAIVLVLAVAGLVAFFGFGSSAPTGSAPGVSPTQAQTQSPPGVSPTLTEGQTPPTTRAPTGPPALVTVAGKIKQILANGDFVMSDGHLDYTIAMTPTPKIVNRTGVEVTRKFIQADGTVQITGILSGSTISAQTVVIPTNKDKP